MIDTQAPTVSGALDGVTQRPYAQETINYHQRLIDADNKVHYIIEPAGEASAINWQKVPTIHRWFARLDERDAAPGYTIRANDNNRQKEVRYKLAPKCSSLEESDLIAKSHNEDYDIRFTSDSMK